MFETRLQCMRSAVAIRREQADSIELRIRTSGLNVSGSGIRAVEVQLAGVEEGALVADIANFQGVVQADLARHLEVPVLDVRIDVLAIRLNRDHVIERVGRN